VNADYHVPVLLQRSIDELLTSNAGTYLDATYGGGGHGREILQRLTPNGRLLAFDQDKDAQTNQIADERLTLIPANFRYADRFLKYLGVEQLDGLLADLGVSSHQFDELGRGFSFRGDASLDMRMNQSQQSTAADVLATYSKERLWKMFSDYGQVRNAKTLASCIVEERMRRPISTVPDLLEITHRITRGNPARYLAQVFQAIRIEVNDEMGALRKLLQTSAKVLKPGGRLVVLTYHSVEDRLVKHFMKTGRIDPDEDLDKPSPFEVVTRKPVIPDEKEVSQNRRASSAKLRVAQKR